MTGVETDDRNRGPGHRTGGAIRRDVRHPLVDAFERHYNDVHISLANQYPGLRRYTRSHQPAAVIGEPCYVVVMLDWDDMAALEAALGSEIGRRAAEDAAVNLARCATFRGLILQLDEV